MTFRDIADDLGRRLERIAGASQEQRILARLVDVHCEQIKKLEQKWVHLFVDFDDLTQRTKRLEKKMAKSAPKSPTKAPLFTKADLPKNRSNAPPPKSGKAPAPKGKGK